MTRKARSKPLTNMTAKELARATAEFDEEFVIDSFGKPTSTQRKKLEKAKRKRGWPRVGKGVKVISVSIERGLLEKTYRLAKRLKVRRAKLIASGLQAVVNEEVTIDR